MNICMIGVGYVGLVVGTCFAEMGHQVICIDNNVDKINALQSGKIPIYEPGLQSMVIRNYQAGRLHFATDLPSAVRFSSMIFIAVGTPPAEDGSADLSYVLGAAEEIGAHLEDYATVVIKSTVPVGSAELVQRAIRAQLTRRGADRLSFEVVSNPEFLREGSAVEDFMNPSRIIVGSESPRAIEHMKQLYEPLTSKGYPLITMDITSAVLAKYAANAMLASRISFMNEMARLCEVTGADIEQIRIGMSYDPRIGGSFLHAGIGYGGSCFPKDVRALIQTAKERGIEAHILQSVDRVNAEQKKKLYQLVVSHFGDDLSDLKLAVWGIAFKPDSDDIREAASIETMRMLRAAGASIQAHDPAAIPHAQYALGGDKIQYYHDPYSALVGADALLIFTEWKQYREADPQLIRKLLRLSTVYDGRNIFDPKAMCEAGIHYYCIGRGKVSPDEGS